jgi:HlyD family secretion protein
MAERVCYNFETLEGRPCTGARPIMAQNSKRKWVLAGLVAGLGVLVLVLLASRGGAPSVPVTTVDREELSATITSNGKVEPISATVWRAQFPAFVEKVHATEGQAVRRGQLVLTLDAAGVRADLAQARSELLAAQRELSNAKAGGAPDEVAQLQGDLEKARLTVENLERSVKALEDLVARQAATQDELAQKKVALAEARANLQVLEEKKASMQKRSAVDLERAGLRVRQAQDQVKALEEKVRSATVIAPADATLYSLPVHKGDYVKVGDVLAEMADLRQVRVRAFVDEPDLGWLEPNQGVQITWDAKPGVTWKGRTETLPKQVVARGSRSVGELICSVDNEKLDLLPNINVEVRILVRDRPNALVVLRSAVKTDQGKQFVFLFDGDRIHQREISVGVASKTKYEILSGLKEGDRVALSGEQGLRDGMEIRPTEAK